MRARQGEGEHAGAGGRAQRRRRRQLWLGSVLWGSLQPWVRLRLRVCDLYTLPWPWGQPERAASSGRGTRAAVAAQAAGAAGAARAARSAGPRRAANVFLRPNPPLLVPLLPCSSCPAHRRCRRREIRTLVLDEADEMLSKGFKEQIYDVYRYLPPETQVRRGVALAPGQYHSSISREGRGGCAARGPGPRRGRLFRSSSLSREGRGSCAARDAGPGVGAGACSEPPLVATKPPLRHPGAAPPCGRAAHAGAGRAAA